MLKQKKSRKHGRTKVRNVLLTGFEPFGGEKRNPSQEIARQLHGAVIARHRVVGAVLPCVFGVANRELLRLIKQHNPVLVICLGQAGGRAEITPERVAINIDDARIADNANVQPIDRPIVRRAPTAYWSTLPIKAIVQELTRREIPAVVSQTAGTFVCNHVFYGLMHARRHRRGVRGGFIHVPFLPEQARERQPSLPLGKMVEAITIAIETSLNTGRDARHAGGRIS